ncbi:MAG: hypothetical protein Aurels2KO_22510 [Aureliella sp.]
MAKVYVAPFVAYLVGTTFISRFDDSTYPIAYSVLVVLIAIGFFILLRSERNSQSSTSEAAAQPPLFQIHPYVIEGITFGVVGIILWIVLCDLNLEERIAAYLPEFLRPAERVSYNPLENFQTDAGKWAFIAFRFFGIAAVVPVAEELFWRGFLLRWIIDPDWEKVPLGKFTLGSCAIVTFLFTSAHPEWFAAAVYCLIINGLLYWRRDLWQCIVAHAVSNALLAAYVLQYKQWHLW